MFDLHIYLYALGALLVFGFAGWLVSLRRHDVSIVDSMWSLMFLLAAVVYISKAGSPGMLSALVFSLTALWAIRLSGYITWRNWGEGEDYRYRQIRQRNDPGFAFKSLYLVFGLQGVLAWIISIPLLVAILHPGEPGGVAYLGVLVWLVGMLFEAVGDYQLARFKADPDNQGKVLDSGLWRYTRHPNYFGNAMIWWGFYLIALSVGGWWTIFAPLLMTFLLLKVSGVVLLEKDIAERRPAYRDYVARTNAFLPGPPRDINAAHIEEAKS